MQQQVPIRGFLSSIGLNPEIVVEFQYNPTQLSDKHAVTYATLNAPGLLLPVRHYSQGGDRTISFNLHIDGLFPSVDQVNKQKRLDNEVRRSVAIAVDERGSILPELNKYRAFLYPRTKRWKEARASFVPLYANAQQFASPPLCRFVFGEHMAIKCLVTEISITETLFNAQLLPLRADIAVTLVELAPYEAPTTAPPGGS